METHLVALLTLILGLAPLVARPVENDGLEEEGVMKVVILNKHGRPCRSRVAAPLDEDVERAVVIHVEPCGAFGVGDLGQRLGAVGDDPERPSPRRDFAGRTAVRFTGPVLKEVDVALARARGGEKEEVGVTVDVVIPDRRRRGEVTLKRGRGGHKIGPGDEGRNRNCGESLRNRKRGVVNVLMGRVTIVDARLTVLASSVEKSKLYDSSATQSASGSRHGSVECPVVEQSGTCWL